MKYGALGIFLIVLAQSAGCEGKKKAENCHIVFDYTYNDQGHIEKLTLDEAGDGSVDARVTYTNKYTDEGWINEVTTKCFRTDDSMKYETVHELNERGRTIYSLYDGSEINVYIHEYGERISEEQSTFSYTGEYDENNRLISETIDLDADGTPDEIEMHTFDADGYRQKYEIDEGADGTVDFVINYTYTFTERGDYESVLLEDIGLITTLTEYAYEYDDEGNLIGTSIDINQDGVLEEECTYTYSDEGREKFCEGFVNGAPVWQATERRDAEGHVLTTLNEQVDDGAASRSKYTYDASGHRLTAETERRDNSESPWEETGRSTYTYDSEGRRLSETKEVYNWGPSTQTCADSYLPRAEITVRR